MNGNEVCVPVVRGRGCRLVSRILPPQLFEFEGGGKGFNSRQELEESPSNWSTIFVSSDRVHFRFNLFEWIAIKEKIFESFYIYICLNSLFFTPKFRDSYFYIYDKYIFELQNARGDFLTSFPRVEINKNNKSCDINWSRDKVRNEEGKNTFFLSLFFSRSPPSPSQSADCLPSRIAQLWHRCIKEEIDARQDGKRCLTIRNNTPRLRLMIGTRVIIGLEFVPVFIHHPPPPSPPSLRIATILSLTYYLSRRIFRLAIPRKETRFSPSKMQRVPHKLHGSVDTTRQRHDESIFLFSFFFPSFLSRTKIYLDITG